MKQYAKGYVAEVKGEDIIGAVASSGSMDRDGDIVMAAGWQLDNFKKNPVLLWAHDSRELPIGKITDIGILGNELRFNAQFASKESEFAKQVADLMKGGFLNAFSVGFMPKQFGPNGEINNMELLEISVVNVPANQEALTSREFKEFQNKVKKQNEEKSPMCRMDGESKDDCVSRKIPEIMKENPDMERDQAVAMASSICDEACEAKSKKEVKAGRVLSDANRKTIANAMDSMTQAQNALSEVIKNADLAENPPTDNHAVSRSNAGQIEKQKVEPRSAELTRTLRIVDRAVEHALKILKK